MIAENLQEKDVEIYCYLVCPLDRPRRDNILSNWHFIIFLHSQGKMGLQVVEKGRGAQKDFFYLMQY